MTTPDEEIRLQRALARQARAAGLVALARQHETAADAIESEPPAEVSVSKGFKLSELAERAAHLARNEEREERNRSRSRRRHG